LQEIIEVMRDAAGPVADRFHFCAYRSASSTFIIAPRENRVPRITVPRLGPSPLVQTGRPAVRR
jgi:hypothetical protein